MDRMRAGVLLFSLLLASAALAQDRPTEFVVGEYEGVPWPIVPPPGTGPLPPAPSFAAPGDPATSAAASVLERIERVRTSLVETAYEHSTTVRESDGVYRWDCSGMAAWIL